MGTTEQADAVIVDHLVKTYKKNPKPAVDDVSFAVRSGEVFGLLGPNGAGKTTTIGVLTTRVKPDSGRAFVSGVDVVADPVAAKGRLAVVPQRNNLDRSLSIKQNLLFHAAYHGVGKRERTARADELLERFDLADRAGERVEMFSGGQMQRVMIARALMHSPDVLFLDEPTTGLDPAARLFLWDQIRGLRADGRTVVLTTHDMEEAASLCDRVGIIDKGHLLVLDTPEALSRSLPGQSALEIGVSASDDETRDKALANLGDLDAVERLEQLGPDPLSEHGFRARLYLSEDATDVIRTVADIVPEPARLTSLRTVTPSLEDVFLNLTGRLLR
jgi:ABC-2 type transport system ATP-binding protein